MSTFRDNLGAALEQIARLEEENRTLRAELLRAAEPCAAPASSKKRRASASGDAGLLAIVFLAGVIGVLANVYLSNKPLVVDASEAASGAAAPSTGLDFALGCTTPFFYEVGGQLRPACLSTPP